MKIILFGVSNVGKTTMGTRLAERLGYSFYDLDEEVKREFHTTLEAFVHMGSLRWRDQKRGRIIKKILSINKNMVFVVSPISYTDNFRTRVTAEDTLPIVLVDTPTNIFDRLVFSDENDIIYKDDVYKNTHKEYYLKDIQADIEWYSRVFDQMGIVNTFTITKDTADNNVDRLIQEYHLTAINNMRVIKFLESNGNYLKKVRLTRYNSGD